jgi:serine/threonine-protein kinase MRCK
MCQPISDKEWVLIFARKSNLYFYFIFLFGYFQSLLISNIDYGVYVDSYGRRTRSVELQFPTQPLFIATLQISQNSTILLTFSSTHIDVFDLSTTQWIQTINLRATRPLQTHGDL